MKKFCILFAAFCISFQTLYAQYFEGQGGKSIAVGVALPEKRGLTQKESDDLLARVQQTLISDLQKVGGMTVGAFPEYQGDFTLTGEISKDSSGAYWMSFALKNINGVQKAGYGPMRCTLEELQNLKGISDASEYLITQMGVRLTAEGRNALRRRATNEIAAIDALVKAGSAPTEFERQYYTYEAARLDPSLAEAAKRLGAIKAENVNMPEISVSVPDIRIPDIKPPAFKPPEYRVVTGNIGDNVRKRQEQYEAQREISRLRQESGNQSVRNLEAAMLAEFTKLQDAVQKQQSELLSKRDILLRQQRMQIGKQRDIIARLRNTENSYETFFTEHPPFEIIYNPVAQETGSQNLERGTASLRFRITSAGTPAMQVIPEILSDFQKGLETIGKDFENINAALDRIEKLLAEAETAGREAQEKLAESYTAQIAKIEASEKDYADQLAKLDASMGTSGYAGLASMYAVQFDKNYAGRLAREYAVRPSGYKAYSDKTAGDPWSLNTKWNKDTERVFIIDAELRNEYGQTIGTASVRLTNKIRAAAYTEPESVSEWCVFTDVPARSITNKMTVAILRVNSRAVNTGANDYIKVSALEPDGFTKDGYDIDGYNKSGYNMFGYNRDGYDRDGYGRDGYSREGYKKDGYDRAGYDKDGYDRAGYTRNGYDREGYDRAGYDKDGYNREGYNRSGYNRIGYNREGYDKNGFDRHGYNRNGYHKDGYDIDGYDKYGYNRKGYNRSGYHKDDYNQFGYNEDGYDKHGYNREGYDEDGYGRDGYGRDGYNRDGYNRDGYDRNGYDKHGRTRLQVQQAAQAAQQKAQQRTQFAREHLDAKIWIGGAFGDIKKDEEGSSFPGTGGFMVGANFIFLLTGVTRSYNMFSLSLIAEGSYLVGKSDGDSLHEGNVGGGLRLASEPTIDFSSRISKPAGAVTSWISLNVSGGVSFTDMYGAVMTVPYLHISTNYTLITGGIFIHFYDSSPFIIGYVGLKVKLGWIWKW